MLKLQDISKSFDDKCLFSNLNFTLDIGNTLAIIGPSGSGKSTLLKIIAGLIDPNSGEIFLSDINITNLPTYKRNIGMVFQDNQLFSHLDVKGNIEFGLRMHKWPKAQRTRRVKELLDLVGLTGFEDRKIHELSGGESKRIALARSLAPNPAVLLLDEPLTGLDEKLHDQLMFDLKLVLNETKTTTILVTHDKSEATEVSNETVQL